MQIKQKTKDTLIGQVQGYFSLANKYGLIKENTCQDIIKILSEENNIQKIRAKSDIANKINKLLEENNEIKLKELIKKYKSYLKQDKQKDRINTSINSEKKEKNFNYEEYILLKKKESKLEKKVQEKIEELMEKRKNKEITKENFSKEIIFAQENTNIINSIERNKLKKYEDPKEFLKSQSKIPRINREQIKKYEKYIYSAKNNNKGSNSFGFIDIQNGYILIQKSEYDVIIANIIKEHLPSGPEFPEIKETFQYGGDLFIIYEKAKGIELGDLTEKQLLEIPQNHRDKLIQNISILSERGICIDPSKKNNFFYDKNIGFSFIDLGICTNEDHQRHGNFGIHNLGTKTSNIINNKLKIAKNKIGSTQAN